MHRLDTLHELATEKDTSPSTSLNTPSPSILLSNEKHIIPTTLPTSPPRRTTTRARSSTLDSSLGGGPITRALTRSLTRPITHEESIKAAEEGVVLEEGIVTWHDPGPPPDGGMKAWLQVLFTHLTVLASWGVINSFGVFETYYVEKLKKSSGDIAWIGSIQICLLFLIGTFSGRATDAGFFHETYLAGTILVLIGIFTTSVSTTYWQLILSQGVCVGLGNGLLFCPALTLLSTYFSKRRSLAIGISACGSSTGGLIFPALVRSLLPTLGFGWTVRIMGFLILAILIVCNLGLRARLPPRRTGPFIELSAFKEAPYTLFAIGMVLIFLGLYYLFYDIGLFATNVVGLSTKDSVTVLLLMNGIGIPSRLIPNFIADRYTGPMNVLIIVGYIAGIIVICFEAVHTTSSLYAVAAFYGIFAAGIQSLFPATLTSLTDDVKRAGVRMGMIFSCVSIACLLGAPIAGAIISSQGGRFTGANIYAGMCIIVGTSVLVGARFAKSGKKIKYRV